MKPISRTLSYLWVSISVFCASTTLILYLVHCLSTRFDNLFGTFFIGFLSSGVLLMVIMACVVYIPTKLYNFNETKPSILFCIMVTCISIWLFVVPKGDYNGLQKWHYQVFAVVAFIGSWAFIKNLRSKIEKAS